MLNYQSLAVVSLVVAFSALILARSFNRQSSSRLLPPGPRPIPILGNLRDLTARELWLRATGWAKTYGDVVYLHVMGQGLVFLNSPEAVFDLLDKKGSIYSDKPHLVMVGELCGCENMVAFTPYGDRAKRQRRLINSAFGPSAIPAYRPLIVSQTHDFLRRLLAAPVEYASITRSYAGSLTLSVVYGYQPSGPNDPFLQLAEECVDILSNRIASGGGIWPVDIFPSLKYLPDWAPGSGFLQNAKVWKAKIEEFVDVPYDFLKSSVESNTYIPSFGSTLLTSDAKLDEEENKERQLDIKWTANSMYSASMDTTITTLGHFLLAMMSHPEVMHKAQEEIDRVVGPDRIPGFEDRKDLPYIDAVLSEIWRWAVPVPLNLPHRVTEDDVYRGMHIPKGSLVFGNIYALCRNPIMFPSPDEFKPERYMGEYDRRMDPRCYIFGFGRRVCPGMHLVEDSLWILIASTLATMEIGKAKDEMGKVVEPDVKFENSVFRMPSLFKCDIRPRSEQALKLIKESQAEL